LLSVNGTVWGDEMIGLLRRNCKVEKLLIDQETTEKIAVIQIYLREVKGCTHSSASLVIKEAISALYEDVLMDKLIRHKKLIC
jgi:hypothetical protein